MSGLVIIPQNMNFIKIFVNMLNRIKAIASIHSVKFT